MFVRGWEPTSSPSAAERELLATGETVRKRTVDTLYDLTPQERQIAQLASEGLTNSEIAAELFISPRTVEWHLGKVVSKARGRFPPGTQADIAELPTTKAGYAP